MIPTATSLTNSSAIHLASTDDDTTLNTALLKSLHFLSLDSKSKFNQQEIQIDTRPNNGQIILPDRALCSKLNLDPYNSVSNACCFLAISGSYPVDSMIPFRAALYMYQIGWSSNNIMVDTDIPSHLQKLQALVNRHNFILEFFIGTRNNNQNNQWFTTPIAHARLVPNNGQQPTKIIRILNMNNNHFELITSGDFIDMTKITNLSVIAKEQTKIATNIKQIQNDHDLALQIANIDDADNGNDELDRAIAASLAAKYEADQKQIESDAQYARNL